MTKQQLKDKVNELLIENCALKQVTIVILSGYEYNMTLTDATKEIEEMVAEYKEKLMNAKKTLDSLGSI